MKSSKIGLINYLENKVSLTTWGQVYFALYILICLLNIFGVQVVMKDAYYYWFWSHKLAWGYYDGPPLIAFVLRLFFLIFGQHAYVFFLYAYFCQVGTAICGHLIAKKLVHDPWLSILAPLLFLVHPFSFSNLVARVTYDNLLVLLLAITLLFITLFITTRRNLFLYLSSVSLSLGCLTKYTACLFLLSFIFFTLYHKEMRKLFWGNKHFYLAILFGVGVFIPHLFWLIKHHWVSVNYLLVSKLERTNTVGIFIRNFALAPGATLALLILFKPISTYRYLSRKIQAAVANSNLFSSTKFQLVYELKDRPKVNSHILALLMFSSLVPTFFWFLTSFNGHFAGNYLCDFMLPSVLIGLLYLGKCNLFRKVLDVVLPILLLLNVILLVVELLRPNVFRTIVLTLPASAKIYTTDWRSASSMVFWLGQENKLEVVQCPGFPTNEYAPRTIESHKKEREGGLFFFYSLYPDAYECGLSYFERCRLFKTFTARKGLRWPVAVYQCDKKRIKPFKKMTQSWRATFGEYYGDDRLPSIPG